MRKFIVLFCLLFICTFAFGQLTNTVLFQYAAKAPDNVDIEELVEYLSKGANSERERAEVIAFWMMQNIRYDAKGYAANTYQSSGWRTTYISGRAVCEGYAKLYKEFCNRADIRCEVVSGFAKGYGYSDSIEFDSPNHAWNVIELNGEFYLMDITWASGYIQMVNGKLRYFKSYKPERLFANPEKFVEQHLPSQSRWQLLNYPISFENFSRLQTFEQMNDSTVEFYNFKDDILIYLELDSIDQQIKDAEDGFLIFPSKSELASAYESIAYSLSNERTKDNFNMSKKYYLLAKKLYSERNDIKRCKVGIEYVDYYLDKM